MPFPLPRRSRSNSMSQEVPKTSWRENIRNSGGVIVRHLRRHVGVGLICSVAYFDPGNWGVDLQAGAFYGYRLLFVVLVAGIIAVFLQVLACRLGCVTGLGEFLVLWLLLAFLTDGTHHSSFHVFFLPPSPLAISLTLYIADLASHCRLLLHSHPKYPRLVRWMALYPLYVLSEVAIISTDLAELLGSAMALCMLFPSLQIWQGVLITAADVLLLLALRDPLRGRPVRMFELAMAFLVLAVLVCMCIIVSRVDVHWGHVFQGYLPSKYIFPNGAFYTSVGILGATVMPHSLFLGSALATQDRESHGSQHSLQESLSVSSASTATISSPNDITKRNGALFDKSSTGVLYDRLHRATLLVREAVIRAFRTPPSSLTTQSVHHSERENNSFGFVRRHLYHGIVDMVCSLLGFAVVINSMILILSSAVFFNGNEAGGSADPEGLFDAYDLIKNIVGQGAATLFAIALLAAGQSSSIIATIAGQAVAEGFLQWRMSPVVRRLLTRVLAVIPSMAVAIALGRPGINALLVVSQVILSIVLPFITLPLIYLTSSKKFMAVKRFHHFDTSPATVVGGPSGECTPVTTLAVTNDVDVSESNEHKTGFSDLFSAKAIIDDTRIPEIPPEHHDNEHSNQRLARSTDPEARDCGSEIMDYSNGIFTTLLASALWLLIAAANVYVIVSLALGEGS